MADENEGDFLEMCLFPSVERKVKVGGDSTVEKDVDISHNEEMAASLMKFERKDLPNLDFHFKIYYKVVHMTRIMLIAYIYPWLFPAD